MDPSPFEKFARERHAVHRRRVLGRDRPWTEDPVLQKYRFTNVYRELDKTTVWFRENVREPLRDDSRVLLATIAFRWFNRIETGRILHGDTLNGLNTNLFLDWSSFYAKNRLRDVKPVVTGAYIIKTPDGMDKLDGVLWCIEQCAEKIDHLYQSMTGRSLESAWRTLKEMPYMGPFMAYEVVTDLRHTHMLEDAIDKSTWANPGPGCRRGLSRLVHGDKDHFKSGQEPKILEHMATLLDHMNTVDFRGPLWEMREVEHTLCEFDKYERARLGEGTPRGRFQ